MTLGLLITIVLVITVIVVASKVREHSRKLAELQRKPTTSNVTTAEGANAAPPETNQGSKRD